MSIYPAWMQTDFGFPKPKRIKNEELLKEIRRLPCVACFPGRQRFVTEAHHITTRGAGGDDVPQNLMPLCTEHHRAWHQHTGRFIETHPAVKAWLLKWEREDVLKRLEKV